jgi:putative ABC transport system substrate-binding protein
MRRRALLGFAAALAASSTLHSQPRARIYRVVLPSIAPQKSIEHLLAAFEQGLRDHGYVPGKDIVIEVRSAEGRAEQFPELVRQVVRSKPDVILTGINANTSVVKAATQSIPIVFGIGTEVVAAGFVQSLPKPGGNLTGLTWDVGPEIAEKRFEFFREIAPKISRVAVLWEPPYGEQYKIPTDRAASALGVSTFWRQFSGDMERDFAEMARGRAEGVYVHHGTHLFARRSELAAVATRHRLPTACGSAEVVNAGALMSYGPNLADLFRRAATYVDKILKGSKPAELPVERPTKLELVVNRGTAKALGLTLPQSLLLRVDRLVG